MSENSSAYTFLKIWTAVCTLGVVGPIVYILTAYPTHPDAGHGGPGGGYDAMSATIAVLSILGISLFGLLAA